MIPIAVSWIVVISNIVQTMFAVLLSAIYPYHTFKFAAKALILINDEYQW